jgi:hypothetical protein
VDHGAAGAAASAPVGGRDNPTHDDHHDARPITSGRSSAGRNPGIGEAFRCDASRGASDNGGIRIVKSSKSKLAASGLLAISVIALSACGGPPPMTTTTTTDQSTTIRPMTPVAPAVPSTSVTTTTYPP